MTRSPRGIEMMVDEGAHVAADYAGLGAFGACDDLLAPTEDLDAFLAERGWPAARCYLVPLFLPDEQANPPPRGHYGFADAAPLIFAPAVP